MTRIQEAAAYLGKKQDRPLKGKNTRLQRRSDQRIAVRYYQTDIVTYVADPDYPSGTVIVSTGGWRSTMTNQRIREWSKVRFHCKKGQLLTGEWTSPSGFIAFGDGAVFDAETGLIISGIVDSPGPSTREKALDKRVKKYIADYCAHVVEHGLAIPDSGDCWPCLMKAEDEEKKAARSGLNGTASNPAAFDPMGHDHYLSHMADDEKYFVPSLLFKALRAKGYRSPESTFMLLQLDAKRGDTTLIKKTLTWWFRTIRPYLLKEIGQ